MSNHKNNPARAERHQDIELQLTKKEITTILHSLSARKAHLHHLIEFDNLIHFDQHPELWKTIKQEIEEISKLENMMLKKS